MGKIELIKFTDEKNNYELIYKWCSEEFIYEWFEQRKLSFNEIESKYKSKMLNKKQELLFIEYNKAKIGLVQIYKYEDRKISELSNYYNIYEYDIFIGESKYLSKGIGTEAVNYVDNYIYQNYLCDCIVLRPFKRNVRAINCYQKNGFRIIEEYDDFDTLGNKEKFVIMMKS